MKSLICSNCSKEYSVNDPIWQCTCKGILNLKIDPIPNFKNTEFKQQGIWKYREAIPISNCTNIVSFQEGFTPLLEIDTKEGNRFSRKNDQ